MLYRKPSFILFWIIQALILIGETSHANAAIYYVSATGLDTNNGTSMTTPWKTISKVNSSFSTFAPGDSVLFKSGETFSGMLVANKSGTSASPITIGAYGSGSKPLISGLTTLSSWTSVGSGVYQADATAVKDTLNLVLLNGIPQVVGRYPNADAANGGYLVYEANTGGSVDTGGGVQPGGTPTGTITDNELTSSTNWTGAEVIIRKNMWWTDRTKITNQSGGTISYATLPVNIFNTANGKSQVNVRAGANGYGYFIQRDARTLDQLGEWYFNPTTNKLQMYFGNNVPSSFTIKASTSDMLINIGSSKFININNLALEGADLVGIYAKDSSNITIEDVDLNSVGGKGIFIFNSPNVLVDGVTTNNMLSSGIVIVNRHASNVTVRNSATTNTGVLHGMAIFAEESDYKAIDVSVETNGLIEYNKVNRTGYCGIQFQGSDFTIQKNLVDYFDFIKADCGGIYTYQAGTDASPGTTYTNRKILNNIVLNSIGTPEGGKNGMDTDGIYLDGRTGNVEILNNSVAHVGVNCIYSSNANNVSMTGTTCFDTGNGFGINRHSWASVKNLSIQKNIVYPIKNTQNNFVHTNGGIDVPVERTLQQTLQALGNIDNNYYATPKAAGFGTFFYAVDGVNKFPPLLPFSEWKSFTGHDLSSIIVPSDPNALFEYNASDAPRTVTLNGVYQDAKKTTYSGTVTIAPWSSVVLIKTSGTVPPDSTAPTVTMTSPTGGTVSGTITLAATATDNTGISKVEFYKDSDTTPLATDTTSPYSVSLNTTTLSNGTHTLKAMAYDPAGNTKTSSVISINVNNTTPDTTGPTVTITGPTAGTVTGTITYSATANDNIGVTKVEFWIDDDKLVGTDTTSPYSVTLNTADLPDGSYVLTAVAVDEANNRRGSPKILVTVHNVKPVDITSPTVALTSPTGGTVSGTLTIAATATDNVGVTKVDFYHGDTLISSDTTSPYSVALDTTSFANGAYVLSAVASDAGGNTQRSTPVSVTINNVNPDTTGPTATITSPTGGTVSGTVIYSATASDNIGVTKVEFWQDDDTLVGTDITSPYSVQWNTTSIPNGTYVLTAVAVDAAGNRRGSDKISIAVNNVNPDTTGPTATITSPTGGTVSGIVIYSATASDNIGVTKVEFWQDDDTLVGTDTGSPYSVSWNTKSIPDGTYVLTAVAVDAAGNRRGSDKISVTVSNVIVDTVKPTVAITSPKEGATVSGNLTIAATATDNIGVSKVDFYHGNTLIASDPSSPYSISLSTVTFPNGTYVLKAVASDGAGNTQESIPVSVTFNNLSVDTTLPTVVMTSPTGGTTVSGSMTISANATDNIGVTRVEFYKDKDTIPFLSENSLPYSTSFSTSTLTNGTHTFKAVAYDAAGNSKTSSTVSVMVSNISNPETDATAPTVSLTSPSGKRVLWGTVKLSATANDNVGVSKVEFYQGSTLLGSDSTSPYSVAWNTRLVDNGTYTLKVIAYDGAGNMQTSETVSVSVKNYRWWRR